MVNWSSPKAIRAALAKTRTPGERFFEGLSAFTASHVKALRALEPDELAKLASGPVGARTLAWILEGCVRDVPDLAVRLADALASKRSAKHLAPRAANAVLYAAQDDNTHQGVHPERLRRALDACVPLGERNADIYVMAAFCAAELKAWDEVIALLGKAKAGRASTLKAARKEKLFAPIATDPRFPALFGATKPAAAKPRTPLEPVAIGNAKAIAALRAFVAKHDDVALGDTWPSDATNVEFWFANKSTEANQHFQQFASTGDGSLLAVWNRDRKGFESGPVVFLGSEGDLAVLGSNVADAIALMARCGSEVLDQAIQYGAEPPEPSATTAWVETTFGRSLAIAPDKAVAAAGRAHGLAALKKLTKQLGGL